MESCWNIEPKKRPTFRFLTKSFERLLGKFFNYLDLSGGSPTSSFEISSAGLFFIFEITCPTLLILILTRTLDDSTRTKALVEAILSSEAPEAEIDLKSEVLRMAKLWCPPKPKTDAMLDHIKYHVLPQTRSASSQVPKIPTAPKPKMRTSQKTRYQNEEINSFNNLGYMVTEEEHYVDMAQNVPAGFGRSLSSSTYVDMTHFQRLSSEDYSLEDNSKQKFEKNSDGSPTSVSSEKPEN